MGEDMGTVFLDGKMYYLKDLSIEELKQLEKKIKEKEKKYQEKIVSNLKK